jgi:hypothetical protein
LKFATLLTHSLECLPDLIPFKWSLDVETFAKDLLRTVKTKEIELLFIARMLERIKGVKPVSLDFVGAP